MDKNITPQVIKTLLAIAGVALLAYFFFLVRSTILYLLISAVIALIGKPIVEILTGERLPLLKLRLNRTLAAAITLIIFLGFFAGILSIFIPALMAEVKSLGSIDFEKLFTTLQAEWESMQRLWMTPAENTAANSEALSDSITDILNFNSLSNTFTDVLGSVGTLVFAIFSIIFITFFFLREKYLFRNIILALLPDSMEKRVLHVAPTMRNTLERYFVGLILQVTIITTLVSSGLALVGFKNVIAIGFFAGLINVIPYLGPIIGMAFGLLLGLAQQVAGTTDLELLTAVIAIVSVFATVQVVDNFVMQPLIFSTSIRAHPLEIFLVISFAAALAGIGGMIAAIPVYSVLRLLAAEFLPNAKFVRWLVKTKLNDSDTPG